MPYTHRQQIEQQQLLIQQYETNIAALELREAKYGLSVPLDLINEIQEQRSNRDAAHIKLQQLQTEPISDTLPYLGLATFQEDDADRFFGRDTLVANLIDQASAVPFLAVLGPSGSGKSSVVLAGLIPSLKGGALPGSAQWCYLPPLKLNARPLDALAATLAPALSTDALTVRAALARDPDALLLYADTIAGTDRRLVLVIDQAEELWTRIPSDPAQQATYREVQLLPFITQVLNAINGQDTRLLIILTMRIDFLHRAAEHAALAHAITGHDTIISPLSEDELRKAIEEPVKSIGDFEPELVNHLVQEAIGKPGALPLLSFALSELWTRRDDHQTMTWSAFHAMGGFEGALAQKAETVFQQAYTAEQQTLLRQVLLRLVQPGEQEIYTRRRMAINDLVSAEGQRAALQQLLQPLVNNRLLTTGRDSLTGQDTIEITHEALIAAWPTLQTWIQISRDDLHIQLKLDEATEEWAHNDRSSDFLWPALRLAQVDEWQQRVQPVLNTQAQAFLQASRTHIQSEQEAEQADRAHDLQQAQVLIAEQQQRVNEQLRFTHNLRRMIAVLVVVLVFAISIAAYALNQRNTALTLARISLARQLAGQSQASLETQPDLALLLGVEAYRTDANRDTRNGLLTALEHTPQLTAYLRQHTDRVNQVAFSPDGNILASCSNDHSIILWDVATHHMIGAPLHGHEATIRSIAFSPDGHTLVSGGDDQTLILWDVATQQIKRTLTGHTRWITHVAFSSDGAVLASGDWGGTIILWNVATYQSIGTIKAHTDLISDMSFSPDGTILVSASCGRIETQVDEIKSCTQGDVKLWNVATRQPIGAPLTGHTNWVTSVAWSPDGKQLATGSWDMRIIIWDVATHQPIGAPLTGHEGWIYDIAFSPNGATLVSSSWDNTVRLWDVATHQQIGAPLHGHTDGATSVAVGPDNQTVASGSEDGTIILWNIAARQRMGVALPGSASSVESLGFSKDNVLAVGDGSGSIRLWDLAIRQPHGEPLIGHTGAVTGVAWSTDGTMLASSGRDGRVVVWDVVHNQHTTLKGHAADVWSVAFSPDGTKLVSSDQDGIILLWDLSGGTHTMLTGHTARVWSVAFSPDGKTIASGSDDRTVRLWNVATAQPIGTPLTGHTSSVYDVAFHPNGKILASASRDRSIIVWDVATQHREHTLIGYKNSVYDITFSPDGTMLASGSCSQGDTNIRCTQGEVRLWDVATYQPLGPPLLSHNDRVFSLDFDHEGTVLASGALDTTLLLWDLSIASWQDRVCKIVARDLSLDEWRLYMGNQPWHATCSTPK